MARLAIAPPVAVWGTAPNAMDDRELSALFDRYAPVVTRRAFAILGDLDEAKDVAQDVFVKAFLGEAGFEGRSQITTWLYRITTNVCLNRLRDTRRRKALAAARDANRPSTMDPVVERAMAVRALLADAEEREALAAIYVYIDGMSHREAAEMLRVSKRTVGNLLERFQVVAERHLGEGRER